MNYKGQLHQDRVVDILLNQKRRGRYLDIGAHNGDKLSNTYFLEYERDWTGVLIEPIPEEFEKLKECRGSHNHFFNTCVSNYNGKALFRNIVGGGEGLNMICGLVENLHPKHVNRILDEANSGCGEIVDVMYPVRTLQSILDECGMTSFDFCSLDVEGSELKILESIDWGRTDISIFIIENNYDIDKEISEFLIPKGYKKLGDIYWDVCYVKTNLV